MKLELFQVKSKHDEKIDIYYREVSPLVDKIVSEVDAQKLRKNIHGRDEKGDKMFVETSSILYFEAVDKKVFAYQDENVLQVSQGLSSLEALFKEDGFVRISKSVVINVYKIDSIKPELNMRVRANFSNGEYLLINRSYKKSFENYLKGRMNVYEK